MIKNKMFLACAVLLAAPILVVVTASIIRRAAGDNDGPAASPLALGDQSAEVKSSLPLFHRLNDNYIRGGQPLRGGVRTIEKLGVRTIVDLRSTYDHTDEIGVAAERIGLRYYWIPLSVWNPPEDEETRKFLSVVTDDANGPFFVFCADGLNRVGEMSAIYRIAHNGWKIEQAMDEMDKLGFNPYYYSLRSYVWTYARKYHPKSVPDSARRVSPFE
ncbi:MAG TPA: hypothetical protein VJQ56_16680 [Blastocatellia bacterium]|nr:hypothetical protein [Blastocatellia bacterium]